MSEQLELDLDWGGPKTAASRTWRTVRNPQLKVKEFHEATGAAVNHVGLDVLALRLTLIEEEYIELRDELLAAQQSVALGQPVENLGKIAKESADLMYVVLGTDVSLGIDGMKAFARVHDSNMSKLVDGEALLRYDGKVLKGPNYFEPDMTGTYYERSSDG